MAGTIGISFSVVKKGRKHVSGRFIYSPRLHFSVSYHEETRTKVSQILNKHKIIHCVHTQKAHDNIRVMMTIITSGWKNVEAVCRLLMPYSITKRAHMEKFLEFTCNFHKGRFLNILGREVDGEMFRRTVNWRGVEELISMVEALRKLDTKRGKYNLKWTPEKIREQFRKIEEDRFPNVFCTDNPRKR